MSAAAPSNLPPLAARRAAAAAKTFSLHLLSFAMPSLALAFVLTGPHPWWLALGFVAVVAAMVVADNHAGPARAMPRADLPAWPFDLVLVAHVALHVANVALLVRLGARAPLLSLDTLVGVLLLGSSAGWSAIVVAHELIHRKSKAFQLLGRLLLVTVLYDHFFVEHVRGHHLRIGTDDDPATARFGERFEAFWRRTVKAQFRSAWRLEAKRLGDADMRLGDPRLLRSTVLHGVIVELLLVAAIAVFAGPLALVWFLAQAWVAIRLLETVNYFEHWGLRRADRKVRPIDSWDADSAFTLYALVGLSRHADHHAYAARPFQLLRPWDDSPKLPRGYLGMVILVQFDNARAMQLLEDELRRKRLGPFAAGALEAS